MHRDPREFDPKSQVEEVNEKGPKSFDFVL